MTMTTGLFPYDVAELATGPVRVLYAPTTVAAPNDLGDIFDQVTPYAAKTGWLEMGSTGGAAVTSRNISANQFKIQQTTLTVLEQITEVVRTMQVNIAEMRPETLQILEEGTAIDTVAAAANVGAAKSVPVGNIQDLTQFRMAFVGARAKSQGLVTEPGGATRGRLFAFVAYRVQLSPENTQVSMGQGDLINAACTFRLYPEPSTAAGEEHGFWIFEDAGTISST